MALFRCCFGRGSPETPGALTPEDMRQMLTRQKEKNAELQTVICRLSGELEATSAVSAVSAVTTVSSSSKSQTMGIYSGWVKFLRSDDSKIWRSVWALLENGQLTVFREENQRSTKIMSVDLSRTSWKLHFRGGAYTTDTAVVPQRELSHIIVLNVLNDVGSDEFYRIYLNTGSEEARDAWMRALEVAMCNP